MFWFVERDTDSCLYWLCVNGQQHYISGFRVTEDVTEFSLEGTVVAVNNEYEEAWFRFDQFIVENPSLESLRNR
jgi:hypothetical protein